MTSPERRLVPTFLEFLLRWGREVLDRRVVAELLNTPPSGAVTARSVMAENAASRRKKAPKQLFRSPHSRPGFADLRFRINIQ